MTWLLGALCALGGTSPTWAQALATTAQPAWSPEVLARIDQAIRQQSEPARAAGEARSARHRIEVTVGQLDPRLRLAPCQQIEVQVPEGTRLWGRSRMGLRCVKGDVRWNVYLPITVRVWGEAVVLGRAVDMGTPLLESDLALAEVDLAAEPSPAILAKADAVGRSLQHALGAGQGLRRDHLKVRRWFEAGEPVSLLIQGPGFSVASQGTALSHGDEGRCARVRMDTGRVVCAQPVGDRKVELAL